MQPGTLDIKQTRMIFYIIASIIFVVGITQAINGFLTLLVGLYSVFFGVVTACGMALGIYGIWTSRKQLLFYFFIVDGILLLLAIVGIILFILNLHITSLILYLMNAILLVCCGYCGYVAQKHII